jgi:phosphohistidine phosphatase SixA
MIVHVIRHGKAYQDSDTGLDRDRALKPRGHRQARALAAMLAGADIAPALVLSSPWRRARETAGPIWEALGLLEQIDDRMSGDRSVSDVIDIIRDSAGAESIGVVGHNPIVSRVVDVLIGGASAACEHGLRTGECAIVRVDPDHPLGSGELLGVFREELED